MLLAAGASVNIPNEVSTTAPSVAYKGFDIHFFVLSKLGETPLHHATRIGCEEIANQLLEYGAGIDAQDKVNASTKTRRRPDLFQSMVKLLYFLLSGWSFATVPCRGS